VEVKTIELALQGGGAHGAFTWGVLDRLLADPRLLIEGISGTSAGAMNAVVLADGPRRGGSDGARAALRRFWDGGYMGNPVLFPLIDESDAQDLVIVQINPIRRDQVPRTARDILNRLNEITFNASLVKELRSVALLKAIVDEEGLNRVRYRDMRLHRIDAEEDLRPLGVSSKLNAEWAFLRHLHDVGWRTTENWLGSHFDRLGRESSVDLGTLCK
jgi:predicted acylesterase/phospholipase RssA